MADVQESHVGTAGQTIRDLVRRDPAVLEVLEEFGIRLDPWTMIALDCSVAELAEYSAIRPEDLRRAIERQMAAH